MILVLSLTIFGKYENRMWIKMYFFLEYSLKVNVESSERFPVQIVSHIDVILVL